MLALKIPSLRLTKLLSRSSIKSMSLNGVLITQLTIHLRPIEIFKLKDYKLEELSKVSRK